MSLAVIQPPPQGTAYHPAWQALSTGIWAALIVVILVYFRRDVATLMRLVVRRLRQGSGVKLGSFELGHAYVAPGASISSAGASQQIRTDTGERHTQREQYYVPNRQLMLVHRVTPSDKPRQLYDVLLYLVPHPGSPASLLGVKQVEYYFGKSWGSSVFTSVDRARGFAIATSAYGPFMCTAEIHFSDGKKVMVSRYVDFEMGALGPEPETGRQER